jgi:hypothetical protein
MGGNPAFLIMDNMWAIRHGRALVTIKKRTIKLRELWLYADNPEWSKMGV